ncbi:MAG: hypothetical protein ACT4PP_12825 [Sporichthyaceae bacterium]
MSTRRASRSSPRAPGSSHRAGRAHLRAISALAAAGALILTGIVAVATQGAGGGVTAPPPSVAAPNGEFDVSARERAVASRGGIRTRGPRVVPAPTAKDAACRLDLGYGVWALDLTAARTLTMLTAVAYRDGRNFTRAARTFERQLAKDGRVALSEDRATRYLGLTRKQPQPRTTSMDAVRALFTPHTLWCATPLRTMPVQGVEANGLTLRALSMTRGWSAAFGGRPLGGFSPEGITEGHIANSAHYDGRAVDISFALDDVDNRARGWLLTHWLAAHADYHQVATLIFDDHVWTRLKSAEGWRPYVHPSGNTESVTLRHLDHIHVDVVQGADSDLPEG